MTKNTAQTSASAQPISHYPDVKSDVDFVALERSVLDFWNTQNVFEASVQTRAETTDDGTSNAYVFYDGPPFANGLPHHGHLLTGFVKDTVARYQTMLGKRVERRFGWDCHGLPAEMEAEKQLGVSGRQEIINFGIEKFNDHCRSSVMRYSDDWEFYVNRQARWVDFKNDYKTMDTPYMESVLWAFSELHKKGLIYEGFKVMPYSWSAETVLSTSEIRLDDATREKVDKAVTVAFKLKEKPNGAPDADEYYVCAWTTTPWTLPSNLALAASSELDYFAVSNGSKCIIVGLDSAKSYAKDICDYMLGAIDETFHAGVKAALLTNLENALYKITQSEDKFSSESKAFLENIFRDEYYHISGSVIDGKSLTSLSYEPLFPHFSDHPNAFRILDGTDFIEAGSGTGIVHMAPGFGEDDQRVCAANGIEVVVPVDEEGRYMDAIYSLGMVETERCELRVPSAADEDNFIELQTNPDVMAMMNGGVMSEEAARADFAENLQHFREYGYGQWAVYHKESGKFMGRTGLTFIAQSGDVDAKPTLRCSLMPEFWSDGYGTECCRAAIDFGLSYTGHNEVAGGCHPDNAGARKMLERLGMRYIKDVPYVQATGPYFLADDQNFDRGENVITSTSLNLKGLNVIQETKGKHSKEPYSDAQLGKYGLANLRIIQWLKATGQLVKQEDYAHNYPHCWRTDKPIIYKAMSSWFVDVPQIRDRMVALNQKINWIPGHIKDGRFGKWLENAREWSISRSRFWGCPIPVWRSNNPDNDQLYVFGSIEELQTFFGVEVSDLHKPYIDNLTKPDPTNPEYTISRVDEVFDCWFESGSMPYAQVHYPFENKEWFEANYPADFIVEYEAQTRGWFYNMMVLAVALFDDIPFKNCICHGVVLDDQGRKLSKRLQNYMDPKILFETYGSDALRWFMLSSTIMRGNELFLDAKGAFIRDAVRLYIKPLWNAYNFFTLYANADGVKAEFSLVSDNVMDRYILAKLAHTTQAVKGALDAYDTPAATTHITAFLEVLNNWYIRRNRSRFWKEEQDDDKKQAYNTLYTVLHSMCRIAAPFLPQITEAIFAGLNTGGDFSKDHSVHLAYFPDELLELQSDDALMQEMDRVQDICNTAHAIRNDVNIRIRQPLASLSVYGAHIHTYADYFKALIADETNVKRVIFSDELDDVAQRKLKVNFKVAGKRLGAKMKVVGAAARSGEWALQKDGTIALAGEQLLAEEFDYVLESTVGKGASALPAQDGLVVIDTDVSDALAQEGLARDVVRLVQQSRKDAGFDVSDRITLTVQASHDVATAITAYSDYICEQTLTQSIEVGDAAPQGSVFEYPLGEGVVQLGVQQVVMRASA